MATVAMVGLVSNVLKAGLSEGSAEDLILQYFHYA